MGIILLFGYLYFSNIINLYNNKFTEKDEVFLISELHALGIPQESKILNMDKISILGGDNIIFCKFYANKNIDFYLHKAQVCGWDNFNYDNDFISGEKNGYKLHIKINKNNTTNIYVYTTRTIWGSIIKMIYLR